MYGHTAQTHTSDNGSTASCLILDQNYSGNMMSVDYWQAKVVSILPVIILDSAQINSICDPLPSTPAK